MCRALFRGLSSRRLRRLVPNRHWSRYLRLSPLRWYCLPRWRRRRRFLRRLLNCGGRASWWRRRVATPSGRGGRVATAERSWTIWSGRRRSTGLGRAARWMRGGLSLSWARWGRRGFFSALLSGQILEFPRPGRGSRWNKTFRGFGHDKNDGAGNVAEHLDDLLEANALHASALDTHDNISHSEFLRSGCGTVGVNTLDDYRLERLLPPKGHANTSSSLCEFNDIFPLLLYRLALPPRGVDLLLNPCQGELQQRGLDIYLLEYRVRPAIDHKSCIRLLLPHRKLDLHQRRLSFQLARRNPNLFHTIARSHFHRHGHRPSTCTPQSRLMKLWALGSKHILSCR